MTWPAGVVVISSRDFSIDLSRRSGARTIGVGKTAERLGEDWPLASVADDEAGESLELLWGTTAVNTWNAAGRRCSRSWAGPGFLV